MTEDQFLGLPLLIASGILIANGLTFLLKGAATRYFRTKSPFWLFAAAFLVAITVGLVGTTLGAIYTP